MEYYLAPMEGYTGFTIRNAFEEFFPGFDKYYTPFLPHSEKLGNKYKRDIDPAFNKVKNLVPQIMTISSSEVNHMYDLIKEYGYTVMNINLGCPSGTVVSKNRGSGALKNTYALDKFLYETMESAPCKISIKTRIGVLAPDEWEDILEVYSKYAFDELIIHPRVQKEFYKGSVHLDAYKMAYDIIDKSPLVYNGDIKTFSDVENIIKLFPKTERIMIGRGMIANPGLVFAQKNNGYPANYRELLWDFHNYILNDFKTYFSGDTDVLMHMKSLWTYLGDGFEENEKQLKKIRKTQNLNEYKTLASDIIHNCPLSILS